MKTSGQVVQARTRRKRNRSWRKEVSTGEALGLSGAHLILIARLAGVVILITILVALSKPISSSSIFRLEEVVTEGNIHFPGPKAEALAREALAGSVLAGNLTDVRQVLLRQPLIKDAVVTRVLPHTLRLKLIEREPVAIVERSGILVAVDEEGIILGSFELMGDQPALLGWGDDRQGGAGRSANLERLRLYLELKDVLNAPEFSYWDQVDYVDVRNPNDAVISLRHSPVTEIHLGDRDFRQRFTLLLDALNAVKDRNREQLQRLHIPISHEILEGKLKITYIDVSKTPPRLWAKRRSPVQPNQSR